MEEEGAMEDGDDDNEVFSVAGSLCSDEEITSHPGEDSTSPTSVAVKVALGNLVKIGDELNRIEKAAGGATPEGASGGACETTVAPSSRAIAYFCFELHNIDGVNRWKVCYLPSRQAVVKWDENCKIKGITNDCVTVDAETLRLLCAERKPLPFIENDLKGVPGALDVWRINPSNFLQLKRYNIKCTYRKIKRTRKRFLSRVALISTEWVNRALRVGGFCLDDAVMALINPGELVDIHRKITRLDSKGLGGAALGIGKHVFNELENRVLNDDPSALQTIEDAPPKVMSEKDAIALVSKYLPIVMDSDKHSLLYKKDLGKIRIETLTDTSKRTSGGLLYFALAKQNDEFDFDLSRAHDMVEIGGLPFCPSNPAAHVNHDPDDRNGRGTDIVVRLAPPAYGRSLQERAKENLPKGYQLRILSERALNIEMVLDTIISGTYNGSAILNSDESSLPGETSATWRGEGGSGVYQWYQFRLGGGENGFHGHACGVMYALWLLVWGVALAFPKSGDGGIQFSLNGGIFSNAELSSRAGQWS